ncbi:linear/branched/unsaturated fatty acid:CoA ligase LbuL [Pontixanthobacter gangjinensis]|uniref:3-methylmercaptopropionyl-CoA ligase n=1 Tax=Pontixanthobacter gangjinensis TaxID=1028742 RepID=A0A6I4SMR2_9SPHN|nr:AMP-binding protein [Pontixanthobacter gangjinensis]MXO56728.1 AMP-binding protein [Pontixanthobacter gangjinensis]
MYKVELTESYFPAQGGPEPAAMTIGDMLRKAVGRAPSQPALKELTYSGDIARSWTYAALQADVERLARALATRHDEGARIAVYANNLPEWVLLELACGLAGVTLVTVNPAYQKRELKFVLEQSRSEAIYYVTDFRGNPMQAIADSVCDEIPAIKHRILLTDHSALYAGENKGALRDPEPGDAAQIQYTSGTTGFPKGALLHHRGLVRNGIDAMTRGGVTQGGSFIHHMPLFHTTGCAVLALGGIGTGATMLLAPMFDPAMVVKVIERERTDFILGVPTMLVALIDEVRSSGSDVSSIERIMSGGAMVAPQLCRDARDVFGAPVQIVYGQTETSPVITQTWFEDTLEDLTETIGQPAAHTELSIRDPKTNAVMPIGEQGEICARAYSVMIGYNDNPEGTAAAIDKDGWLHTGDLGRIDARGYVKITGRVKEMIIRGGENLFPAEIENAMLEHAAIEEVAVVGIPDEKWGEQVACFIRSGASTPPSAAELKAFIRERLSPQKTPAYWINVTEWPLTGSGKIQKFKLQEAYEAGEHELLA